MPPGGSCSDATGGETYVEVAPERGPALAQRARGERRTAKLRCGPAVPTVDDLARGDPGVPSSTASRSRPRPACTTRSRQDGQHGFLNLLAAAVFGDEEAALAETTHGAFGLDGDVFRWRDRDGLGRRGRAGSRLFVAFGSCSFAEPVDDLRSARALVLTGYGVFAPARGGAAGRLPRRRLGARPLRASARSSEQPSLNAFMAAGPVAWRARSSAIRGGRGRRRRGPARRSRAASCRSRSPTTSTSTPRSSTRRNLGPLFRPDSEPLLPNWRHLPGRLPRPGGDGRRQRHAGPAAARPVEAAGRRRSRSSAPPGRLDIELELGFVVGVAEPARRARARRALRRPRLRRSCSSTTGARATCRRGSTSRSARSSASRSRRRSRRG